MKEGDAARYEATRKVPFLDVHDSMTSPVECGDLVGMRRTQVPDRAPQADQLDATEAQGGSLSIREFGGFPTRLISAIRLLGTHICPPGQQHEVADQDCAFDWPLGGFKRTTTVHHECSRALGMVVDHEAACFVNVREVVIGCLHSQMQFQGHSSPFTARVIELGKRLPLLCPTIAPARESSTRQPDH